MIPTMYPATKPFVIFDLDGTLADVKHRRDKADEAGKPFFAFEHLCKLDPPVKSVVNLYRALTASGYQIDIWSGRSGEHKDVTINWLHTHLGDAFTTHQGALLRMRLEGDNTPDTVMKESWLHELPASHRNRLEFVVDDRDSVVAMWRANGVVCLQAAPGNF